jgi:ATP dependent DNA ligase domain
VEFTVAFQRKKTEAIGIKAALPGFVDPALAFSIDKVPSGSRWIHEIKFDGYRVQVHLANEAVRIFTRRGLDAPFQEGRPRRLAHQGGLGGDRWRDRGAGRRRHY